ncbi:MAG TPA: cytosolic protein [Cyanobacteria bacterium UBA11149]|nr:cytosolic protein [Cyanobacteria bacterium UBA11367]HBE59474.1 cytosolic protein [Cyanobacteria bacterium UBA11366]HBK63182.1 cytosolic protein [Cyanobacteria bacterium UBA11166]HBR75202.1 cytosolic protein [Cyanobacteria bacterium UBA11159]HBS68837.1 cytosolic protein [Cyanobacteria bacterium UBA11153]HBW88673.1 cytosolic protein [Cyanobacteria bacterium UBA11149]
MTNPQTEFDTPWKDAIERYFPEFMAFFFPQANAEIDWTKNFEFLDKELQQVVRDAELGKRLVDKLVKLYRQNGEEAWVLIHIEVQSQEESNFAQRMFVYNYRIYDRYKRNVASLAVLGDERDNWRPNQFGYQLFGCRVGFHFPVVKVLDYQQEWQALELNPNPFATVVMAHLKAQETKSDRNKRKEWKLILTRRLYQKGYGREDIINLFSFIDWVMSLPEELEQEFWQELRNFQEEQRMPYITSVERIGIRKGIEESQGEMRQILLDSIELGLDLKFTSVGLRLLPEFSQIQNVELLRKIQRRLRTANTLEEFRKQVLLDGIELDLEVKFGAVGLSLLPEIAQIQNVELLQEVQNGVKNVTTIEELRQIYLSDLSGG